MDKIISDNVDNILQKSTELINILLKDNSSNKNIIWATDDYKHLGKAFEPKEQMFYGLVANIYDDVIKPRVVKSKEEQILRIRNNAEVFTPSWICNEQNNLIDQQWFEGESPFNKSIDKGWQTITNKIDFSKLANKTWTDYVKDIRLEITCGEAPYLTSRYDTVTGNYIEVKDRIGLLDRKLRIINENVDNKEEWIEWAQLALKSIYGYEFQGDSLLIARENVLLTVIEHYYYKFGESLDKEILYDFARIISWNLWQMDGLKYVIPYSCHNEDIIDYTLFGEIVTKQECIGCKRNAVTKHNGVYCKIKDWDKNKNVKFVTLATRGRKV
ncbi:MAG: restriction endonuclease subunit M [Erysipelotrichaceae bacterium]|nr:restriction endonuclease subunit M [Erysipelotrichaceae bacterium]